MYIYSDTFYIIHLIESSWQSVLALCSL